MCDEWMPTLEIPLTAEQFHQLPRNAAYRYEYAEGRARVSPRGRFYHARLDLSLSGSTDSAAPLPDGVSLRPLRPADFTTLARPFATAFTYQQPFAGLTDADRGQAAQACLERTRRGGDGPWVEAASFVAETAAGPIGAVLVTLLPHGDPSSYDTYYWQEPPPDDCIRERRGQPHLTWIFVVPGAAGQGLGTALLAQSARALLDLGFTWMLSTFLLGNDSSMLWHWRAGFELLAYTGSRRRQRFP